MIAVRLDGEEMEISIPIEELQKKQLKIMVATPMYGGMCTGNYSKSIADLAVTCARLGVGFQLYYLYNESLIQRARNYCVDEFLRSDCTHLMFIDADIGFNAQDVVALLILQDREEKYDVIGGAYPKKCISWEKIKLAVDKGFADKDPNILDKFVGDYVFNPKNGAQSIRIDEPAEVLEIGTGFMMIRRSVFDRFKEAFPEYAYKPDHARTEHFKGDREIVAYFDCSIDPETRRYLSEDYHFCQLIQKIGCKIWLCPWMQLTHTGTMIFGGSLADIASIGASATA